MAGRVVRPTGHHGATRRSARRLCATGCFGQRRKPRTHRFEVMDRRVTLALCEHDLDECKHALDALVALGLPSRPVGEALYWWGRACLELLLHRFEPALHAAHKMMAAAHAAELPAAERAGMHNCRANVFALAGHRDEARAEIATAIRLRSDFFSVKLHCNAAALE